MDSQPVGSMRAIWIPAELRNRTCVLELVGTSAPFMQWAAAQAFADIVIGPPALEVLFRRYYQPKQEVMQ